MQDSRSCDGQDWPKQSKAKQKSHSKTQQAQKTLVSHTNDFLGQVVEAALQLGLWVIAWEGD